MSRIQNIDWKIILKRLEQLATSNVAREELERLQPLDSPKEALKSFSQIEEVMGLLEDGGTRPFMESLDLYGMWSQRLSKKAVLKPLELKDIRHFCIETITLKETLKVYSGSWVNEKKTFLMNAKEPLSAIDHIMLPDGSIRTDASEKLYQGYHEKSALTQKIQKILDRAVKDHQLELVLQDRYVTNRQGRWVLPIKSGMQSSFDGIIHASSQSQKTVFMEPGEVIPINNQLKQVESEIEEEIERLLSELSTYLYGLLHQFETAQSVLLEADILFAKARFSLKIKAKSCQLSQKSCQLINLRHPLLELNGDPVVPNTISLEGDKRILLLSGPNAGGKTVLLKSFGLAAQMVRCGLPITADPGSKVPFFKEIFVDVGDSQSVGDNLSTFAAHLNLLNEATKKAKGKDYLVLIDEICSSTDPEEGSALARSFIYQFAEQECFAIITSHFGQLKKSWEPSCGVINGSLEFSAGKGPTYHFFMGVPGRSLAIQTAQQVGIDPKIIDRAMDFISPEYRAHQKDIDSLEGLKEQLSESQNELKIERKNLGKKIRKYESLINKFTNEREDMLKQVQSRAEDKVNQLIQRAKVDDIFRKHSELQKVKKEIPMVIQTRSKENSQIYPKGQKVILSAEDFAQAYPPGSRVYVSTLQKNAIVQGQPNSRGETPILSDSMRLMVPWEDLQPPQGGSTPTPKDRFEVSIPSPTMGYRTIDLRGQSSEEAISQLEIELDTASMGQEERVKVIYGHGTEKLKRSVRNYLSRCIYVKKWDAGTNKNGGDGLTWVFLKDN